MKMILIGFMGAGKTSVAKVLGKKLKLEVIDMDDLALKQSKRKSINEIFEKDGEAKFRKIEFEVANDISGRDNVIIATGGGVVVNDSLMNKLKLNGLTVYLKNNFDKINEYVQIKKIRPPLFQNIESARKLFNFREPLYTKYADKIIETDNKSIEDVTVEIINNIK